MFESKQLEKAAREVAEGCGFIGRRGGWIDSADQTRICQGYFALGLRIQAAGWLDDVGAANWELINQYANGNGGPEGVAKLLKHI